MVDDTGAWTERKDVRFVRYMSGKGPLNNEWMTIKSGTIGPEFGLAQPVGNALEAPVMILKCCIGNRSLGWDLLPPGSKQFEADGNIYAGYKDPAQSWPKGTEPKPGGWYAGKQYDDDVADAKKAFWWTWTSITLGQRLTKSLDSSSGKVRRTVVMPCMQPNMRRIWCASSLSCAKTSKLLNVKFVLATLGEATKAAAGTEVK